MCTCCQNTTGCGCRNRCGCGSWRNGCGGWSNGCCGSVYNGCATVYNGGNGRTTWCGTSVANTSASSACASVASAYASGGTSVQSCARYISFPVSGTAYVPTSAITFCPNVFASSQNEANANSTSSSGCGCFGRCGGAAAISNYFQDYYARQYGLNDD